MLELAIATRFLVDFFWSEKILSLLHTGAFAAVLGALIARRNWRLPKSSWADIAVLVFAVLVLQSFLRDAHADAAVEASKILAFCLFYALGRVASTDGKYLLWLGRLSFIGLAGLAAAGLMGVGYVDWGGVTTFAGGYFFKTDAALAALTFFIVINVGLKSRALRMVSVLLAGYVVVVTNARIALPIMLVIAFCCAYLLRPGARRLNLGRLGIMVGSAAGAGVLVAAALSAINPDLLSFDLADPFSDANTQGRTVIWAALVRYFLDSSLLSQVFGSGLLADQSATSMFSVSQDLVGARSHNSLLYLLLAVGVMGTAAFLWVLLHVFVGARRVVASEDLATRRWGAMLLALTLTFVVMSLTVDAVMRPQLMIPLFLTFGAVVSLKAKMAAVRQAAYRVEALESHGRVISRSSSAFPPAS